MLKVSHLTRNGFGISTFILTRNHQKAVYNYVTRPNKTSLICLSMTSWRPFWIICIFWRMSKVSCLAPRGFGINSRILTRNHQETLYILKKLKNKGDVFAYDVMAAILNNLHIMKILKVSRLRPGGFGISTSILTKSHQINLFMSKNKEDVFVYEVSGGHFE